MDAALRLDTTTLTRREHLSELLVWKLAVLFLAALLFRLMYNSMRELVPDEAYYWVWSRHLSLSYFDHPPMVAYLIWASTKLLGSTEFGVRLPAALLSSGTVVLTTMLVRRLTRSDAATWMAALLLLTSPVITLAGTLMTPDSPLIFFVVLGLTVAVHLFDRPAALPRRTAWWCLLGACCGLAMLSKYTGVLLPFTIAVAMLTTRSTWPEFRRPGIYLAGLIAAIFVLPILIWNNQHQWASLRFQFVHGFADDGVPGALGFLGFIASVLLTWTPIFCILFCIAVVAAIRQYRQERVSFRLILLAAVLPLVLFSYSSFRKKVEANWPAMALAPAVILVAAWAVHDLENRRRGVLRGVAVALGFTIVAHLPETALLLHLRVPPAYEVFGWRSLAQEVDHDRDHDEATVVCSTYQNAAELSFYLQGQPDVWSINYARRHNAYDYFTGKPDLSKVDHALFVGGEMNLIQKYYPNSQLSEFESKHLGQTIRKRTLALASR